MESEGSEMESMSELTEKEPAPSASQSYDAETEWTSGPDFWMESDDDEYQRCDDESEPAVLQKLLADAEPEFRGDDASAMAKDASADVGIRKYATPSGKTKEVAFTNSMQWYLSQIRKIPVLNGDEEWNLGRSLIAARLERDKLGAKMKKQEEERSAKLTDAKNGKTLAKQKDMFEAARKKVIEIEEKFVLHNLRLVVYWAHRYDGRGLSVPDLIQEGTFGIRHAAEKFEPERGYRFATYGANWIRQRMGRALRNHSREIRIPVYVCEIQAKYLKTIEKLKQATGCHPAYKPSAEEIAADMGVKVAAVRAFQVMPRVTLSLDTPLKEEEGGATYADVIRDSEAVPADEEIQRKSENKYLDTLLKTLSPREQWVIKQRYGLHAPSYRDTEEKSLQQIGDQIGVTREWIRQIESASLRKMRVAARKLQLIEEREECFRDLSAAENTRP